ncbi:calcium-binding protein [Amylibacter sp. SFDW26]|uniref:choice-of-anchor L domain-containing protein n=1 Tax=Amylibacter sp. SFDW26 TaxID=2652722 RepID=UPI0012628B59|nr:choice-of-anchor L domain-containing protein [Amylibacter sp. SFDW26]KAB7610153.1 calcium-binding protein [Amylibacter sp. SFDW26]
MVEINGTAAGDALQGTQGADIVTGFGSNDIINGGGGNDLLIGDGVPEQTSEVMPDTVAYDSTQSGSGGNLSYSDVTAVNAAEMLTGGAVEIVSANLIGSSQQVQTYSDGATVAPNVVPGDTGLILSTGNASGTTTSDSNNPNTSSNMTTDFGGSGDVGLDQYNTPLQGLNDAAGLEFSFEAPSGLEQVTLVLSFASEEFPEYVNAGFSDLAGVFVNGVLCPIDGTTNGVIDVDNGAANSGYTENHHNNDVLNTQFDGVVTGLTVTIPLVPGELTIIRIVIADEGDGLYDSALFLAEGALQFDEHLAGNDTINGGLGDDTIQGNEGSDLLIGGQGADSVDGGTGDDLIEGGQNGDLLIGGEGHDVIYGGSGVNFIDNGLVSHYDVNGVRYDQYGNILPEDDDIIYGGEGADSISGSAGHDILDGGTGGDVLSGGSGNDVLYGGEGFDDLNGGGQDDAIYGGLGRDELVGGSGDDILDGGADEDNLSGGAGADTLDGGSGDDKLFGGVGDDILIGGSGNDELKGSTGNDRLTDSEGNNSLYGGSGNDNLEGGTGQDLLDGGSGDDILIGGGAKDTLKGGSGADELFGGAGSDKLYGGSGDDFIFGDAGKDYINAGKGDDVIDAGEGDDKVISGRGADQITGGAGSDWFVFRSEDDDYYTDTITDFTRTGLEQDRLDLRLLDLNVDGLSTLDWLSENATQGEDGTISINIGTCEIDLIDSQGLGADFMLQISDGLQL